MKHLLRNSLYMMVAVAISLTSCKKDDEVKVAGDPTITPVADATKYEPGATVKIKVNVAAPGKIKEVVIGSKVITSGFTSETASEVSADYVIPANAPNGQHEVTVKVTDKQTPAKTATSKVVLNVEATECTDFLTDCNDEAGKTWVLKQGAGALVVAAPNGDVWWSNPEETVAARPCLFDDEYTFTTDGAMIRNTHGNTWADEENGAVWPSDFQSIGCHDFSEFDAKYAPWGDGEFTYTADATSLSLDGMGVYMGLYKAGDQGTVGEPEDSNTYEIITLTADELVVKKTYDWGSWTFSFQPKAE